MQNHHRSPRMLLVILVAMGLFFCGGCASVTEPVARDATSEAHSRGTPPELSARDRSDTFQAENRESLSLHHTQQRGQQARLAAALTPMLPRYEDVLKTLGQLGEGTGSMVYGVGVLAIVLGALLVGGTVGARGQRRRYQSEITRRRETLEAAVRMLSSDGVELRSAQRYPTSDGDLTAAEAELLRSTVRNLGGAPLKEAPGPSAERMHA